MSFNKKESPMQADIAAPRAHSRVLRTLALAASMGAAAVGASFAAHAAPAGAAAAAAEGPGTRPTAADATGAGAGDLITALATLKAHRFVDLTHAFAPGIPHWKGAPNETVKTLYTVKKDGFRINEYCHIGQWGTHVDPPAHFHEGLKTVDRIDPKDMLMPLVVIDVHEKVAKNPDYTLSVDDIKDWEKRHGPVPKGAFVAMRTDWGKRWPDQDKLMNKDAKGVFHYPGYSKPALQYLYEQRGITASGHETTDT